MAFSQTYMKRRTLKLYNYLTLCCIVTAHYTVMDGNYSSICYLTQPSYLLNIILLLHLPYIFFLFFENLYGLTVTYAAFPSTFPVYVCIS